MKVIKFVLIAALFVAPACRRATAPEKGVATPSVALSRDRVALGSPVDITYRFVVAPDAPPFTEKLTVFVGVVDTDEQLMWTEDHQPPIPTTEWKPNQTITYTRTVFVPVYPYVGEAAIHMGLYSTATQKRVPLNGNSAGQHAYKVARFQLLPQTENVYTVFKEGWHPAEVAQPNSLVEWQWTKKTAVLSFRNPKKECLFYLDLDNPGTVLKDPQQVRVRLGSQVVDEFTLTPGRQILRKIVLKPDQLGTSDLAELSIEVDRTFVPALQMPGSKDPRELGVRVFHAFVQPVT